MTEASEGRITIGFKKPELLVSLQDRPIIKYKGPLKRLLEEKKFQVTTTVDQNWYPGNIPCRVACPIGTNARGYSRAIAEGKYQLAYLLARQNNPFVSVLGKVCSAPCEPACQRGKVDEPVSIRALKYFAVEKNTLSTKEVYRWLNKKKSEVLLAQRDKPHRVAVVGAGPAGLSAAHDLALMGYRVKVFEASGQPGGMLNTIPSYRLDGEDIKRDIEGILFLGIELETNKSCGKDFSVTGLLKEYHAVLLAPGLQRSKSLDIPGIQLKGVLHGLEFLREVAARGKVDLGKRIVVIGGGDMALDVARTALRLVGERGEVRVISFEAAKGSKPDRPQEEVSAHPSDIATAEEEGIAFYTSLGPRQIVGENGWIKAVELRDVRTVYNGDGQFNPVFEEGEGATLEADTLILALGQDWDSSSLKGSGLEPKEGIENPLQELGIDPKTLMASHPGVFFCGDAVGSRNIVEAMASAQKAAQSIHLYLGGSGYLGLNGPSQIVPVKHHERMDRFLIRTSIKRMLPPIAPVETRRKSLKEPLERSYSDHVGREQGERCLDCSISPVIGPYYPCHVCGDCLDVCPTECLSLRFMNKQDIGAANGKLKEAEGEGPWVGLLIDEELCIHCGMCAEACPADAISMIKFEEVE